MTKHTDSGLTRTLIADNGIDTYDCTPTACGYTGRLYCQNCGDGPCEG
jgi:hypothetical protein